MDLVGPRKLVRPSLPAKMLQRRYFARTSSASPTLTTRAPMELVNSLANSSHAEAFYLQKQAQGENSPMVFVLEGGEKIEGYIEWYDQHVIKVRHSGRTLIYKSCIKYLFKGGETVHS